MSGRAKKDDGILHVPVMMDIQALTRQDFSGLTKEQKKKAIKQLKLVMQMVDPQGQGSAGLGYYVYSGKENRVYRLNGELRNRRTSGRRSRSCRFCRHVY